MIGYNNYFKLVLIWGTGLIMSRLSQSGA